MFEGITYFGIESNLSVAINDGGLTEPVLLGEHEGSENALRSTITQLLNDSTGSAVAEILFACILELATNATKANMKYLYFHEHGWDIAKSEEYGERLKRFKIQSRDQAWVKDYARKAKETGLWVQILFTRLAGGVRVEVTNNLPLIPEDERRVREKMQLARKYTSIIDFFQEHGDDTEGEGLGFAMSVIMLKREKIDPDLFRIGSDGKNTTAAVEIPFA